MSRYSIRPLQHNDLWDFYKKVTSQIWLADAVNTADDRFDSLDPTQQEALKMLLFFFANSDKIVADNLALNLLGADFVPMEAEFFYAYQLFNENVHSEVYADLIEAYIRDPEEKHNAYNAITNIPTVSKKLKWADKWINNGTDAEKLIAFAVVEGLLFSSTFAFIFWLRHLDKPLSGLYFANDEIATDENTHYQFAVHMFNNYVSDRPSPEVIESIIMEGYEIEKQYVEDYFGDGIKDMSKEQMVQYVQYTTDCLLTDFGLDKKFDVTQPLSFMKNLVISGRTNFFEKKSDEYSQLKDSSIEIGDIEW